VLSTFLPYDTVLHLTIFRLFNLIFAKFEKIHVNFKDYFIIHHFYFITLFLAVG